eukprot:gene19717-25645_t
MPPKPQIYKSPDGKEFTSKKEWRDYMMATFYSFKNKVNEVEPLIKKPGEIDGQMFDINIAQNLWYDIFDHNDPSKSNANWSIIPENEYEEPWYPQGSQCSHAIPLTKPGSVVRVVDDSSMQSFDFQQLVIDSAGLSTGTTLAPVVVKVDDNPTEGIVDTVVNDEEIIRSIISKYGNYKAGCNNTIIC